MDTPTDYEYHAGVKDKVKQIEIQLGTIRKSSQGEEIIVTASKETHVVQQREHLHLQLTKQPQPAKNNEVETEQQRPHPIPLPRKYVSSSRPSTLPIQEISENTEKMSPTFSSLNSVSVPSTRRSSVDDGIADMTSELDILDDSAMPFPKIKENAFYIKDRQTFFKEMESFPDPLEPVLNVPVTKPSTFRHDTRSPSSSSEDELAHIKLRRTRTDSTNSADNYFVQEIFNDVNRRKSDKEVKSDTLQCIPVGESPVVMNTMMTLNNSTASILVLGFPLSGKSSTINSLVQANVACRQESISSPPEIVEYTAKIKILDSPNLFNLKIVETPGYTNDANITFDAQLMATLFSYIDSKEGLRGKSPTVVLIILRFDDARLWNPEDEHPDIVNFLKLLNNFQSSLNDGKHANFVFVLTHFLNQNFTEKAQCKPQSKIVEFTNLIQKYTLLASPVMVVCAENEPTKSGSDVLNNNDQSSSVTLPNGEIYPYNLIEKIKILLTKKGRDSVGETVLRTAFGIEYPYSIKECRVTQRRSLVPASFRSVQKIQKEILHAYLDIERTEVFKLLEIGWENVELDIRKMYPDSLFTVQQIFQTKKVRKFEDVPEEPAKVLNLIRQMPSNPAVKDLLVETLQLKVPAYYPALYIGQGYDLSKDASTSVSPFQFASELKTSPVGMIPKELQCKIRDDREIYFKFFYTEEEYILDRLKDMSLRYAISANSLTAMSAASAGKHRRGYNLIRKNQEPTKSTVATAIIEYRVFQLTLNQQPCLQFKPQFWESVEEIPDLDINDSASVTLWKDLFGYWGTHVVQSAFGGGSVEITFKGQVLNKIFHSMKKDFILPSDEYDTTRVFQWITGDGLDFVASCGKGLKSDFLHGYDVEAHFRGGDIRYQSLDVTKLESKERVAEIREEWKEGLVTNPIMLENNLVLVPISHFVRKKSEEIAAKIDVALHYFYSDLKMTHKKKSKCSVM